MQKYKKRKDGRYAKQVTVGKKNGLPIKKTVYGKTIIEVEKKYREMMLLVDKGVILKNNDLTIAELYEEWYRIKKSGKIRDNTIKSYRTMSKHIIDGLGDNNVKELTMYSIENLIIGLINGGKMRTASTVLRTINEMMNYAVRNNMVAVNPCGEISVDYKPKEKRPLTAEEKESINTNLHKLKPRQQMYLLLLRYTGMRKGEVLALSRSDIDREGLVISVNKTLVQDRGLPIIQDLTKTKSGIRKIPIFPPLAQPLFEYIDGLTTEGLFMTSKGNYISVGQIAFWTNQYKKYLGFGEDITNHSLRHTFITECFVAGIDLKTLQKWVGHSDISTTLNIYTHLSDSELIKSEKMNNFYSSQKEVKTQNEENENPKNQ